MCFRVKRMATTITSAVLRCGVDRVAPFAPVAGAVGVHAAYLYHIHPAHVRHCDLPPRHPHWTLDLQGDISLSAHFRWRKIKESGNIRSVERTFFNLSTNFIKATSENYFPLCHFEECFNQRAGTCSHIRACQSDQLSSYQSILCYSRRPGTYWPAESWPEWLLITFFLDG